jgi:hypothetical protein
MTPMAMMRRIKRCKLALPRINDKKISDFPTSVKLGVGSGSASKWKVESGYATQRESEPKFEFTMIARFIFTHSSAQW